MNSTIPETERDINNAIEFIKELMNQNWQANFGLSREDRQTELATSLVLLREELYRRSEQEIKRQWMAEGLSLFAEIIKRDSNNLDDLCRNAITAMSKYLNARAGVLYLHREKSAENPFFESKGVFATSGIKEKQDARMGLLGQCFADGDIVLMNNVPSGYLKISSGLGESTPATVVLATLKFFGGKAGIVELAFFEDLPPFKIDFLKSICESIAAAIIHSQAGEQTRKLLTEAREMAGKLKSQEEKILKSLVESERLRNEMKSRNEDLLTAHQLIEKQNKEIEEQRKTDAELLESKLKSQEEIYSAIIHKLRTKIQEQQKQLTLINL
jgi:hypothetical protein